MPRPGILTKNLVIYAFPVVYIEKQYDQKSISCLEFVSYRAIHRLLMYDKKYIK